MDENGNRDLPTGLAKLAARAGIVVSDFVVDNVTTTPRWQNKRNKTKPSTPSVTDGATEGALLGLWFVLTGTWPSQGGGRGLTLGKERFKAQIKKFCGSVTTAILGVTNVLVMGENPGKKKALEAHKKLLKIINIEQMICHISGDFILDDITTSDYPNVATAVLDTKKIQVQCHPQSSVHQEQTQDGTAGNSIPGQEDDAALAGAGHSNG
jgi:hypothetical protein